MTYSTQATPLPHESRLRARQMAEAHASDAQILEALRADVYDSTPPGPTRDLMLSTLQVMHPEDHRELCAYRGRAIVQLHMVLWACAMQRSLNDAKERHDPELHGDDAAGFEEVDPKAASVAQFLGRVFLAMDADALHEEARAKAQEAAEMSTEDQRRMWLRVGLRLGLSDADVTDLGGKLGLSVIDGGRAG